jgi:hypothetical protein
LGSGGRDQGGEGLAAPWYRPSMPAIRARVQNGRLLVDAPTTLPEGTVLDLVVDDEGDELGEDERAVLDAAISHAVAAANAGHVQSADEVLKALRTR